MSMHSIVVRQISRTPREVVELLSRFPVATLHEAQGRSGLMQPYLRPIYAEARAAGTAVTVQSQPGDNLMVHAAMEVCQPGDFLLVGVRSESTDGMFGELLAASAKSRGVVGLVIDAGVRDTRELSEMRFPVWAKAVSAQGVTKSRAGSVNLPVVAGGVLVNPGDIVVADGDGVVIVERETADEVARRSAEREERERELLNRLSRGELGIDIYGFREKLRELGVTYLETAP